MYNFPGMQYRPRGGTIIPPTTATSCPSTGMIEVSGQGGKGYFYYVDKSNVSTHAYAVPTTDVSGAAIFSFDACADRVSLLCQVFIQLFV